MRCLPIKETGEIGNADNRTGNGKSVDLRTTRTLLQDAAPLSAPTRRIANRLLPAHDLARIEPEILKKGSHLITAGEMLGCCYFIEFGLVSVLNTSNRNETVEVALVGSNGMIGLAAFMGVATVRYGAIALTDCRVHRVSIAALHKILQHDEATRARMLLYAHARMAEAMQLSACHASHRLLQRLARWILTADDLLGGESIPITHEALARLFGVRRAGITTGLHELESERTVRSTRGRILVTDPVQLAALSCGCEQTIRREFAQAVSSG